MRTIRCTWKGVTPLLMNNCQCVNPLHPISVAKKKLTGKRAKTEEDLVAISDLDWEGSLYWDKDIGLFIPSENIEACIRDGAKATRKGKDIVRAFDVQEMRIPLDIGEDLTFDQLKADYRFRDVRQMKIQRSRVTRTRGRFDMWKVTFTARYDENLLDFQNIVDAIDFAGAYVGLCDSRPRYGKFAATIEELD